MKLKTLTTLLGLIIATSLVANQIQVGYPGSGYGPWQTGQGGEFTLNDVNPEGWLDLSGYSSNPATQTRNFGPSGITSFQTFCLEGSEHIYPYGATYNAAVSQNAIYGGVGAVGDPISKGTGWLYSQFATGTLASYNYTGARKTSAALLQNALWWLEGEMSVSYTPANPFMASVVTHFGSASAAMEDGGWSYGVHAINLTDANGNRFQDQLYYHRVSDGGATIMLLGSVLGGIGLIRRRD